MLYTTSFERWFYTFCFSDCNVKQIIMYFMHRQSVAMHTVRDDSILVLPRKCWRWKTKINRKRKTKITSRDLNEPLVGVAPRIKKARHAMHAMTHLLMVNSWSTTNSECTGFWGFAHRSDWVRPQAISSRKHCWYDQYVGPLAQRHVVGV